MFLYIFHLIVTVGFALQHMRWYFAARSIARNAVFYDGREDGAVLSIEEDVSLLRLAVGSHAIV
jgi:hypothetical protein